MSLHPLLRNQDLPPFSEIDAKTVENAVIQRLKDIEESISRIEAYCVPTWEGLIEPLCDLEEQLHRTWSPVDHLNHVANSQDLRESYEKAHKLIVDFHLRYLQSQPIYDALIKIQNGPEWEKLDEAQHRSISQRIQAAQLAGLSLKAKEREEFNALNKELSQLEFEFSNKLLDSTKEFLLELSKKEDVLGLPETLLELASETYNKKFPDGTRSHPENGPWAFTLEASVVVPFLENAKNSELRKKLYLAYISRASSGSHDNTPVLMKILKIRKRVASLLQYKNYAELSLTRKMVASVEDVFKFQEDLRKVAYEKSREEFKELQKFANENGFAGSLRHWDIAFWAKRLEEKRFQYKEEELKPYFAFDRVLSGLFTLAQKIFSIKVEPGSKVSVWDKDVRFYDVFNEKREHIASFYLDPYSRPENKRGGAWVNDCVTRFKFKGKLTLPVAYIVCNFTPPTETKPSLMTFDEVTTIFHEFGHALQHMLTKLEYRDVSGTNGIEWDAIELASQFMENWCYHRETIRSLAKHYQSGEVLPDFYIDKLIESRNFRAASQMLRQVQFGLIDMKLHSEFDPDGKLSIWDLYKDLAKQTSILPFLNEDRTLCSFGHIFSGAYAAGYYSYKWAEVMSADAFSKFEEAGLDKEETLQKVGKEFRDSILALGGGRAPLEVFKDFRGRAPTTDALLRHSGLLA